MTDTKPGTLAEQSLAARSAELTELWKQRLQQQAEDRLQAEIPTEIAMPIGDPVLAIRANVRSLIEAGRMPQSLIPYVTRVLQVGREQGGDAVEALFYETEADYVRLLDAVWVGCVVAPRFTEDGLPSDDRIPVRLVPINNKIALLSWTNGVEMETAIASVQEPPADAVAPASPKRKNRVNPPADKGADAP